MSSFLKICSGGSHFGDDLKRTGIPGLGRAVRALNLESDVEPEVDFTASSIGSLNDTFLKNLYLAAKGEQPQKIISRSVPEKLHNKFRIYFPLHQTVLASIGGPQVSIVFDSSMSVVQFLAFLAYNEGCLRHTATLSWAISILDLLIHGFLVCRYKLLTSKLL
jgi:Tyrosyl-DNA phosphodiesterase